MDIGAMLQKLDITAIVAAVISFVLGLGFIKTKLSKAMAVLTELADLISTLNKGLEDGKLTKDEIQEIVVEANELLMEFKK